MKQFGNYSYEAVPGETITIIARFHELEARMVTMSKPFQFVSGAKMPTWTFSVPREDFEEVYNAFIEVSFSDASSSARIELTLKGSKGGEYKVPAITPDAANKAPAFTFWVG